ncbi:aminoglycoside adenylyltransferase domain-containing protein [Saccharopolyspora sp. NPDC050389]|uniref:aminoglycoside adenylyltransferase domain-containing protein n=1 Tax=Saccharopolyspora sp. NPDC050389 TaxID=3155516 RepID=UPI0033C2F270
MLQHDAESAVARYLTAADRLLPGKITGFYVVGSAALGAWRPGRRDIDLIAVVDGGIGDREARRLRGHWRDRAEKSLSRRPPSKPLVPAHRVAVNRVLGPPRLHCTIATGQVITKESAAEYALDTFAARWHPLIRTALAHRTGEPEPGDSPEPGELPRMAGEFILELIADANRP